MPLDDINRIKHMLDAALESQTFMKDVSRDSLSEDRKITQAICHCHALCGNEIYCKNNWHPCQLKL